MKKTLILMLTLGLAPVASATLSLVGGPLAFDGVGQIGKVRLHSDADGPYACWLEIADLPIADYTGEPIFTEMGNPNGDSQANSYEGYDGWYEIIVASLNPDTPIVAGEHVVIEVIQVGVGITWLNLYAEDGATLLDSAAIYEPEPTTFVMLGLGGLALLRKRNSA